MEAMEARGYEERRPIYTVCNCEGGFKVLHSLEEGEIEAEKDGKDKGVNSLFSCPFYNTVMGPGDCNPGS